MGPKIKQKRLVFLYFFTFATVTMWVNLDILYNYQATQEQTCTINIIAAKPEYTHAQTVHVMAL